MPSAVQAATRIFEDPDEIPKPRKYHKRVPSVGDVLRGRKVKEKDSQTAQGDGSAMQADPSPLSERHLNSPPQPRRGLAKSEESRPQMHKKTTSAVSLKGFMKSKDKVSECESISSTDGRAENCKPKKPKSSTNLPGLLQKRSRKDLQKQNSEDATRQENVSPTSPVNIASTPIWAQFTTQPLEDPHGKLQYPLAQTRSIEEEIKLYTPNDYSEFRSSEQRNFHDFQMPALAPKPPQRPFLEHRTSRSSIFKENLDEETAPALARPESRDHSCSRPASSRRGESRPFLDSHDSNDSQLSEVNPKRKSRIFEAISTLNVRSRRDTQPMKSESSPREAPLSPQELDSAFEKVLDSLNIPQNMRENMRSLKADVKIGLMRGDRVGSGSSATLPTGDLSEVRSSARSERPKSQDGEPKDSKRTKSRSRTRSRILSLGRRDDASPTKKEKSEDSTRSRSKSRPRSIDLTNTSKTLRPSNSSTNLASLESATTPGDFIHYLKEVQKPELVEVGKLHKLRILLRNESVTWTDTFVKKGGMDELVQLLYRIMKIEWREEHEDTLLHETLLCLKALCTTTLALQKLSVVEAEFFPALLAMLFDDEKRGPADFSTRGIVTSLLFAHLSAAKDESSTALEDRAKKILGFLHDPQPEESKQLPGFISQMHTSRPYKVWCREVSNVTKEVFWIFLHHMNVVPIIQLEPGDESAAFSKTFFPPPRPPHPAAPYVGGVEWEATQYLSTHLELLNGLIASIPTKEERNGLRAELRQSGWEKVMGGTLRTCKEKFYGGVHEGLKLWIVAAKADGWLAEYVRAGPPRETSTPKKSPVKRREDEAPKLALEVGVGAIPKMDETWI